MIAAALRVSMATRKWLSPTFRALARIPGPALSGMQNDVAGRLSSQRVIRRVAGTAGPAGGAAVIARNGRT
jgi:hypothetical protein